MSLLGTVKNPGLKKELFQFTQGIEVDAQLCKQEIQVQKAWLESLVKISLVTKENASKLSAALDEALALMISGQFPWRVEDEDIHMNLERFITEKLGELGKQLHLGRSRNDLIATTLRLFVRDNLDVIGKDLVFVIDALCDKAESTAEIIVPGSTHLQHAQPVRFGHILAAHGWGLLRDLGKIQEASKLAMLAMPLGSAALAGTTLTIDLSELAARLGFSSPPQNSYDAVGDRDFMMLAMEAFASTAMHLSRLSEDFIFWSSTPVGLLRLPKNWSTGSSIMPNKRNPDVPELIRGKASHIMGAVANGYLLLKGLPTSYDSDLHELKSVYLRSQAELQKCLHVLVPFIQEVEINADRAGQLLASGHLLATEIANHLTAQGVSFREAYGQTAALVEAAESAGVSVEKLSAEKSKSIAPNLNPTWLATLNFKNTVEFRHQAGGTSLARTREGIANLRAKVLVFG